MQVPISPQTKETLIMVTNDDRISWFAEKSSVYRHTIARLRREDVLSAESDTIEKIEAALQLDEVRQLIKKIKKAKAAA